MHFIGLILKSFFQTSFNLTLTMNASNQKISMAIAHLNWSFCIILISVLPLYCVNTTTFGFTVGVFVCVMTDFRRLDL